MIRKKRSKAKTAKNASGDLSRSARDTPRVGDARAKTVPAILVILLIVLSVILTEFVMRLPPARAELIIIGAALFLTGGALRIIAQINLGKDFAYEVVIYPDQRIVKTGIHRYIRHPMYIGLFLLFAGLSIALQAWAGLVIGTILLIPLGVWRMKVEEDILIKEFGKEYTDYMKTSKKVIPWIW